MVAPQKKSQPISAREIKLLAEMQAKEFSLQDIFKFGYRNKEDISNLPANTLVVGSQNVLTNAAEQVAIRQGYQLDGSAGNQNNYGIDSAYDFETRLGIVQNLRKWGGNLEVRYLNPTTQAVSWINISTANTISGMVQAGSVLNFTNFYSPTEASMVCLFVGGTNAVGEWSGGIAPFASATSSTITVNSPYTLGQLGFYNLSKQFLTIDGVQYSYSSAGSNTSAAFTGNGTTPDAITPTVWWDQKFTSGAAANEITTAALNATWSGSASVPVTAVFTGQLYTDSSGNPGTPMGAPVYASIIMQAATTYTNILFTFNLPVSINTTYHFVISCNQFSGVNIERNTSSGQGLQTSTNSGTSWAPTNGPMNVVITENDISPQTFYGVTPDPTLAIIAVGDPVIQQPTVVTSTQGINITPNGTAFPTNWTFDFISTLSNQVWYGSKSFNFVYVSATDNYNDVSFGTGSSTVRLPAQGAFIVLDAPPNGFSPQGLQMYATAGRDQWWVSETQKETVAINNVATTTELLYMARLKTSHNQAAQSQNLVVRFKNSLVYVSNEQIINALGLVKNVYTDPQVVNMSDPIKYDIDAYNFTGGDSYYDNYYIYFAIPNASKNGGIVRLYNVNKKYWEAPQTLPVSRFYHVTAVVGDIIFGHSSLTNESYQLFTGYGDNGNPINSVIAFPYISSEGGAANQKKAFNKVYTEGYIASNTTIMLTINYDFGGFSGTYTTTINGTDKKIIFNKVTDGSLGQNPLGSQPIGSILNLPNTPAIPKFRVINTMPRINVFEYQIVYSTDDVDQQYALLRFGPAVGGANTLPVEITE